mmetsp:Transcript_19736/g.42682  ORF Transcript_19736/g.42682 Transcript_19736/m.42682 type:complete len:186 (-) Transcript_19736:86-643(-)
MDDVLGLEDLLSDLWKGITGLLRPNIIEEIKRRKAPSLNEIAPHSCGYEKKAVTLVLFWSIQDPRCRDAVKLALAWANVQPDCQVVALELGQCENQSSFFAASLNNHSANYLCSHCEPELLRDFGIRSQVVPHLAVVNNVGDVCWQGDPAKFEFEEVLSELARELEDRRSSASTDDSLEDLDAWT